MIRDKSKVTVHNDEDINPCIAEADFSYACSAKAGSDKSKCNHVFENYKECKRFWSSVSWKRKQQGVKPHMPPPLERKQIIDFLGDKLPYIPAVKFADH